VHPEMAEVAVVMKPTKVIVTVVVKAVMTIEAATPVVYAAVSAAVSATPGRHAALAARRRTLGGQEEHRCQEGSDCGSHNAARHLQSPLSAMSI
jgi:hypothetical protein